MKTILITGYKGFLGQKSCHFFKQHGYRVIGLDKPPLDPSIKLHEGIEGSVTDKKKVLNLVNQSDIILHLAALTSHHDIVNNKFLKLNIDYEGTKNLLDAFIKSEKCKELLFTSSGKVYGDIKFLPLTENHPPYPIGPLGKSKLITEQLIDYYVSFAPSDKRCGIFRIFNIFGEGQKDSFLIPTIIKQLNFKSKKSQSVNLGDIEAQRDYVYVGDVLDAFLRYLKKTHISGTEIFNVCSNQAISAREIVDYFQKCMKINIFLSSNKDLIRVDEKEVEYSEYQKINRILGWKPKMTLKKWISNFVNIEQGE